MKKTFLLLLSLFLLAGCKDVKLTNGENALVTFKEGGISSDELYQELEAEMQNVLNELHVNKMGELPGQPRRNLFVGMMCS